MHPLNINEVLRAAVGRAFALRLILGVAVVIEERECLQQGTEISGAEL